MQIIYSPRNPRIASLMSLVLPGFGQLYNGEVNKAIWQFLGFALLSVPGVALIALYLPSGWMMPALLAGIACVLGLWMFGIVDAWRTAKAATDYVVRPWQTPAGYALVFLLCNVLTMPLLISAVRAHQVESFYIPSTSMEPSVMHGDILFADKRYNCPGCKGRIQRGDIAVFTYPNDRTLNYIKRIIGLPGDHIQITGHEVLLNGKPLGSASGTGADTVAEAVEQRQWQVQVNGDLAQTPSVDVVVPPGQVFVLGDNRAHSADSRQFGCVPMQDVMGLARQVWFSRDQDGTRWQRLGLVL